MTEPTKTNFEKNKHDKWYAKQKGLDIICKNCGMRLGRHNGKTDRCPIDEYSEEKYRETKFEL